MKITDALTAKIRTEVCKIAALEAFIDPQEINHVIELALRIAKNKWSTPLYMVEELNISKWECTRSVLGHAYGDKLDVLHTFANHEGYCGGSLCLTKVKPTDVEEGSAAQNATLLEHKDALEAQLAYINGRLGT